MPNTPLQSKNSVERLSPTKLRMYDECPKKFEFEVIKKCIAADPESPHSILGNAVHEALAKFYGVDDEFRTTEMLERCYRAVWVKHADPRVFLSKEEEEHWGFKGLAMLKVYAENFDLHVRPLARELWVKGRAPNGVNFTGKVDRIDELEGGGVRIIDYKTGSRMIDAYDMGSDRAVQVYAMTVEGMLKREVQEVQFLYLPHGADGKVSWLPEREDIEAAGQRLIEVSDEIRETEEFPAYPGEQCKWCRFAAICPDKDRVDINTLVVPDDMAF